MTYHVRVNHELGFFSFYDVEAEDRYKAGREAEKIFIKQFCGSNYEKSGDKEKYKIETYVFVDIIAEAKRDYEIFNKRYNHKSE
jgi:c-di-AMP phosphodiesterase-like protein